MFNETEERAYHAVRTLAMNGLITSDIAGWYPDLWRNQLEPYRLLLFVREALSDPYVYSKCELTTFDPERGYDSRAYCDNGERSESGDVGFLSAWHLSCCVPTLNIRDEQCQHKVTGRTEADLYANALEAMAKVYAVPNEVTTDELHKAFSTGPYLPRAKPLPGGVCDRP